MTSVDRCDWSTDGGGFSVPCGGPAVQWIIHSDGGSINAHCHAHFVKMNRDVTDEGWVELTREEAEVWDVMQV